MHNFFVLHLTCVLSLCASSVWLQAQDVIPSFHVTKLTPDDGLSQGSNYFRYEDSKGFMWLTANDALNRFDGVKVKVYNLDRYFKDCPPLQQGYGFAEDDQSNVYVGSVRGLYVYHRDLDKFTLHKVFDGGVDDIAMPICCKDGKIWCFNRQYQLATYDTKSGKSVIVTKLPLKELASVHIYQLLRSSLFYYKFPFIDKHNKIWVVGEREVLTYDIFTGQVQVPFSENMLNEKSAFFSCHYDYHDNKVLLGTTNEILIFDIETKAIQSIKKQINSDNTIVWSIISNKIYYIFKLDNGIYYIKKRNIDVGGAPAKALFTHYNMFNLTFDKSNRLWACDDGNGTIIINFDTGFLNKEPKTNVETNYFGTSGFIRFAETQDGLMVLPGFLNEKNKLVFFNSKTAEITNVIDCNHFFGCLTDKTRNGVWLFSEYRSHKFRETRRIVFLDKNNKQEIYFEDNDFQNLSNQQDMQVLPDGRLLCSFAKGLFWLDPLQKRLLRVKDEKQASPFKINLMSKGRIAVSYLNGDMVVYQAGQGFELKPISKILQGEQSFYLQEDTVSHRFWVGTNQGVYVLDEHFKTIKKIDANNGLAGTYIYGLLLDDQGNAYCSHQRGLSSIDGKSFHVLNFDKSDGIQDWDFNNKAFFKASDGTMYFGGSSGFNYFKPPLVPSSFYRPEVYVDEFLVNGVSYNTDKCANLISEARLDAGENNIEIHAIVKDLVNGRSRKLVYRLKETDYNWTFLPNNTSILFNNLAPGRYTLELGTYDKYSNQMLIQKKINISIAAPFYATTWFLFLVASVSTAAVFMVIGSIKESRRRSKLREEQGLEEQRRAITADLHDDIGASLSSLQINSSVARRLMDSDSSQAHSFLEKIENQSQDLADKIGDIIWSMKPGEQEFMTMSSRIKNFVNDILGATTISYTVDIEPEIDSLAQSIPLRKNLIMIAKESVNNAAKYSQASKLELTLRVEGTNLLLLVKDNGVGFEANGTQGNGLYNMKKRAQELGGELTVTSKIGLGTEVNLRVPYP